MASRVKLHVLLILFNLCDKKNITAATPLGQDNDNLKKTMINVKIQIEKNNCL